MFVYRPDAGLKANASKHMQQHLGQGYAELLAWLSQTWIKEGPPVCFVEGFSGIGKTSLARDLVKSSEWDYVMVDMPEAGFDQADNLFLRLSTELSLIGINEMATAVDNGTSLSSELEKVLRRQILIVIDEFQHALVDGTGKPTGAIAQVLEKIANRPKLPCRLLLLSNHIVQRGRWSEPYSIRTLSPLEPEAAELLLDNLLKEANRSQEVSSDRRRDVVNWLGRNPRAIQVLVTALERDSLDDLIGLSPEIWDLKDRDVSPELLYRLERELLERTLSHLKEETNRLLRRLSVHRKSVKREAIETLLSNSKEFASVRDNLINCFLMEQHSGWFTLNPIVREISLQRLKESLTEVRQAHSKAADYYMRHFTAKNIVGGGQLGGYFVEARYHLVQSKREEELIRIAERFENHLRALFKANDPIPKELNELNERIAVLSALLERPGSKGLEYYLARLYQARGAPGDLQKALTYAQRATGPKAPADTWVLRIRLEGQFNGPERALQVCREGIENVSAYQNLFALYQSCGELLGQAGRLDEAIILLKEGIARIPPDQNLFALYQSCGELLAQAGRLDEAIILLKEGIARIPPEKSLFALYQSCGELLGQAGRLDEAIILLKEGITRIPPEKSLVDLYLSCGELLAQAGRVDEAITLLQEGIVRIPPDKSLFALYQSCGKVLSRSGRVAEAIALFREGIDRISIGKGNRHRLVESALFLCTATCDSEALEGILSGIGTNVIDPQQVALGKVLRLQMQREWKLAAEISHQRSTQFSTYLTLIAQEAFSWLAIGDAMAANEALRRFPRPLKIEKENSIQWLKALVAVKNEDQKMARECLSIFLGRSLSAQEEIDTNLLLSLWDTNPDSLEQNDLAYYYPTLPGAITGLPYDVTRLPYGPSALHINVATTPNSGESVLAEAGERKMMSESTQSTNDSKVTFVPEEFESASMASRVLPSADQLEYKLEEQPWYAAAFPQTIELNEAEVRALSNEIDIVIITANDVELRAVMHQLKPYPKKRTILLAYVGSETYYLGKFGEYKAVVTKCRIGAIGVSSAILATASAEELWRPKAIIMVGVAFGNNPAKQKIGDVLVASEIIPYEQQRVGVGEEVIFRGPIAPSNATLLNRIENAQTWHFTRPDGKQSSLRVGPILSGEKLVDNPEFKAWLFQRFPQAIGGEMEGSGLYAASGRVGVAWILVKSICDWGDGNKLDLYQPLAAAAAVSLVLHVLSYKTVLNSINKRSR